MISLIPQLQDIPRTRNTIQVQVCHSPVTVVRARQWQEHVSGGTGGIGDADVASAAVIVTTSIVCGPCEGFGVLGRCGCLGSLSFLPGGCGGALQG